MKKIQLSIASIFVVFVLLVTAFAQESERTIKRKTWKNEPLEIQSLKVKGINVSFNQKFLNGNDWFGGLAVNVKNISNKTIVFIDLTLNFPPSGGATEPASEHLLYGQEPLPPGETDGATLTKSQLPLQTNSTATLTLDDYQGTRDFLNEVGQPQSIGEIELEISEVVFNDGTKWSRGSLLKRDPNDSNKSIPIQNPSSGRNLKSNYFGLFRNVGFVFSSNETNSFLPLQNQCRTRLHQADFSCGVNRCAVRFDYDGPITTPGGIDEVYLFRYQNDRCVDRRTHQRCSVFRRAQIIYYNCSIVQVPNECDRTICDAGTTALNNQTSKFIKAIYSAKPASFRPVCPGCPSPIIVDINGNGFALTNARNGVEFDLNNDGKTGSKISWTVANSDDAWLVLDRNNNGTIDGGSEMFGNYTAQPLVESPHGFLALAEFDKTRNGGNRDGFIDSRDEVFSRLNFWQDLNHNGFSEQNELHTISLLGVAKFDLDYRESRRTDAHGNQFEYRAKVWDERGAQVGRWAWDVFLVGEL